MLTLRAAQLVNTTLAKSTALEQKHSSHRVPSRVYIGSKQSRTDRL